MKIKLLVLFAGAAMILLSGCQTGSNTGTLTSVTITNQPVAAINQAVDAVLVNHGFSGGQTKPGQFAYHRTGTRSNNLAYNNFTFDEAVTIQLAILVRPIDANSTFIGCDAWLIEAGDDQVFDDSHQIRHLKKWPYQQLLKDIQTELGQ